MQAKFHEMEEQIAALSKQLQTLQALQSRNQILEVGRGRGRGADSPNGAGESECEGGLRICA